jgi:hypothetical protein
VPLFDVRCVNGHETEAWAKPDERDVPCRICGAFTTRLWRQSPSVQSDAIIGGFTDENLGPTPVTYYSKSERRRLMKERGLEEGVRHVGVQGSDKSPHTQRWDVCPAALLISEADRLKQWYATEAALTAMPPHAVKILAPEPEPALTAEQYAKVAALAARVL